TDQECSDPIDCAFYAWPSDKKGFWECKSSMMQPKKCVATANSAYCGTNGNAYCFYSTTGYAALETDLSCPVDCDNQPLQDGNEGLACDNKVDCIFINWPNP
ncbi:MAG TPA: hypothetical protein PKV35_05360, partial [bacterium]|nr:hypothetical protein [bacterium]